MQKYLAPLAAFVVVLALAASAVNALAAFSILGSSPNAGVTSCAKIAYDYVAQVAQTNGLRIDGYKLLACRQVDADHAVARAHVLVSPIGLPKGVFVQDVILVYHLTKSDWQISDVHPVG